MRGQKYEVALPGRGQGVAVTDQEPPCRELDLLNVPKCTLRAFYSLQHQAILCWLIDDAGRLLRLNGSSICPASTGENPTFWTDDANDLARALALSGARREASHEIEWLEARVKGLETELGWLRKQLRSAGYKGSMSLVSELHAWLEARK